MLDQTSLRFLNLSIRLNPYEGLNSPIPQVYRRDQFSLTESRNYHRLRLVPNRYSIRLTLNSTVRRTIKIRSKHTDRDYLCTFSGTIDFWLLMNCLHICVPCSLFKIYQVRGVVVVAQSVYMDESPRQHAVQFSPQYRPLSLAATTTRCLPMTIVQGAT